MPSSRIAFRHEANPVEAITEQTGASDDGDDADPPLSPAGPLSLREVRVPHAAKLVLGLCVTAFCAILYAARNLDFYFDEWSFIGTAGHWQLRDYFVPHNEHWSTVPMLIYKALLDTVGLRSYLPYLGVLLLLHVSIAFLLFLIIRRRGGDVLALSTAAVMLFLGRGYENLLWAFQIGFLGSVAFGLLAIYLLGGGGGEMPGRLRAVGGSAALLLALMSSGIGLFFFAAAAVDLFLDGRRRRLLWVHIAPGLAYLWWYFTFGQEAVAQDHTHLGLKTLEGLVGYAPVGIGSAAAGTFALSPLWAPVALAGLTATAVLLWYRKRLDTGLSIAAAVAIVLQYTLTGLVRARYGDNQAMAPRYAYIGAVFVLMILAEALRDARWRGVRRAFVPITAACMVAGGATVLVQQAGRWTDTLATQKYELEITWLFRDAPSLDRAVVLDRRLLPVINPSLYIATRLRYGTHLPELTVAQLAGIKPLIVNSEMRTLLPLHVTSTTSSTPLPAQCRSTVPTGSHVDLTVPDGSTASVQTLGAHAASQVNLAAWYLGNKPDGGYQQWWSVTSGHDLTIAFPDSGQHLSWHFRLTDASGGTVAVCVGAH